jgi:hypothetical protein
LRESARDSRWLQQYFILPLSQHSYILILEYSQYGTCGP